MHCNSCFVTAYNLTNYGARYMSELRFIMMKCYSSILKYVYSILVVIIIISTTENENQLAIKICTIQACVLKDTIRMLQVIELLWGLLCFATKWLCGRVIYIYRSSLLITFILLNLYLYNLSSLLS